MMWIDVSERHDDVYQFVWAWHEDGDNRIVVWRAKKDLGYGTGVRAQYRNGHNWLDSMDAPDDLEEAKALALVLYRMGGE